MAKSKIEFNIELDNDNIPEKIVWNASDKPGNEFSESKSISVALWDENEKNTMRIDLWTKDMPITEMKYFYIDCLGGMAQTILSSTGDEFMSNETKALCDKLVAHLKKELENPAS